MWKLCWKLSNADTQHRGARLGGPRKLKATHRKPALPQPPSWGRRGSAPRQTVGSLGSPRLTAETDGVLAWSLPGRGRRRTHTLWMEGPGHGSWRSCSISGAGLFQPGVPGEERLGTASCPTSHEGTSRAACREQPGPGLVGRRGVSGANAKDLTVTLEGLRGVREKGGKGRGLSQDPGSGGGCTHTESRETAVGSSLGSSTG